VGNQLVEVLDQKIKGLESQLDGMRTFRDIVASNPSVATEVVAAILDENSNGAFDPTIASEDKESSPVFTSVVAYFKETKNAWATVGQIHEATGIHRSALHTLISFGKHRFLFESKKISTRKMYWRLKVPDPENPDNGKKTKKKPPSKKPTPATEKKEQKTPSIRPKWGPVGVAFEQVEGGDVKQVE
jgi:hypothetical protein